MGTNYKNLVIGVLSMGKMGSSIASQLRNNGYTVVTSTTGRSEHTKDRARELRIADLPSSADVFDMADVVFSICSGGGYYPLAREAYERGFSGVYVEANSVPPDHAVEVSNLLSPICQYVDAGIYGYPIPEPAGFTTERTVYAYGKGAGVLAELLSDTAFTVIQTDKPGKVIKEERHQYEALNRKV